MTTEAMNARFEGWRGFGASVESVLLRLPDSEWRELLLVDIDFGSWPLGGMPVLEALTRWIRLPGRRLKIVGLAFDDAARCHPRLAAWRRDWGHAIDCLRPTELEPGDMPCLLLAGTELVEVLDREHWRGVHRNDAASAQLARQRVDAISQRCEPGWPANHLGL
jgi:hypothetical protein